MDVRMTDAALVYTIKQATELGQRMMATAARPSKADRQALLETTSLLVQAHIRFIVERQEQSQRAVQTRVALRVADTALRALVGQGPTRWTAEQGAVAQAVDAMALLATYYGYREANLPRAARRLRDFLKKHTSVEGVVQDPYRVQLTRTEDILLVWMSPLRPARRYTPHADIDAAIELANQAAASAAQVTPEKRRQVYDALVTEMTALLNKQMSSVVSGYDPSFMRRPRKMRDENAATGRILRAVQALQNLGRKLGTLAVGVTSSDVEIIRYDTGDPAVDRGGALRAITLAMLVMGRHGKVSDGLLASFTILIQVEHAAVQRRAASLQNMLQVSMLARPRDPIARAMQLAITSYAAYLQKRTVMDRAMADESTAPEVLLQSAHAVAVALILILNTALGAVQMVLGFVGLRDLENMPQFWKLFQAVPVLFINLMARVPALVQLMDLRHTSPAILRVDVGDAPVERYMQVRGIINAWSIKLWVTGAWTTQDTRSVQAFQEASVSAGFWSQASQVAWEYLGMANVRNRVARLAQTHPVPGPATALLASLLQLSVMWDDPHVMGLAAENLVASKVRAWQQGALSNRVRLAFADALLEMLRGRAVVLSPASESPALNDAIRLATALQRRLWTSLVTEEEGGHVS